MIRKVIRDKRKTAGFSGFLYKGERYADNINFYEELVNKGGWLEEKARFEIKLLKRFPPGIPHDREVLHVFDVFELQNGSSRVYDFDSVASFNIGEIVREACNDEANYYEIPGLYPNGVIGNPYLHIHFDNARWRNRREYAYDCYVRTDINWNGLFFRVTEIFSIDGVFVTKTQKELTPIVDDKPLRLGMRHVGYWEYI